MAAMIPITANVIGRSRGSSRLDPTGLHSHKGRGPLGLGCG